MAVEQERRLCASDAPLTRPTAHVRGLQGRGYRGSLPGPPFAVELMLNRCEGSLSAEDGD